MAEKEPKPKTPRARSTTTKKVARKTVTKKTTKRAAVVEEEEMVPVVAPEPVVEEVRPVRASRRKGMTFGFLLSCFALLSAASAAAVYIGYTAEGQINVAQRLAEAPANLEDGEDFDDDSEDENASDEPVPQGIPFGTLEIAGDGAVPSPPPPEPASTTEAVDGTVASSSEPDAEEATPEPHVEGAETSSEPAPVEAVTPEEAAVTQ